MTSFTIKQYDTKPAIEAFLTDENGDPRSLQDATSVEFHMRSIDDQELVTDDTATIIDASEGRVVYEWKSGDTDKDGRHNAEFEVFYTGGDSESFPNYEDIDVFVKEPVK